MMEKLDFRLLFFGSSGRQTPIFTVILLVPRVRDILPTSKSTKVGCVTSMFFMEVIELFIPQVPDRGTRGRGWLLVEPRTSPWTI